MNAPTHEELANVAKSCGVVLCKLGHEASKEAIYDFVSDLVSDSIVLSQYASRSTILSSDIIYSLRISSNRLFNQLGTFYGSDNEVSGDESHEEEDMDYTPPSIHATSEGSSEATLSSSSSSSVSEASEASSVVEGRHIAPKEMLELDGFSISSTSMQIYGGPTEESPISLASIADVINTFCRKRSLVLRIEFKALHVLKDVVTHHLSRSYSGQSSFINVSTPAGGSMRLDTVNYLLSSPAIMPAELRRRMGGESETSSLASSSSLYSAPQSSLYSAASSSWSSSSSSFSGSSTASVRRRLEGIGSTAATSSESRDSGSESVARSFTTRASSSTEAPVTPAYADFFGYEMATAYSLPASSTGSLRIAPPSPDWDVVKNTLFASPFTPQGEEFARAAMEMSMTPGFDLPVLFERESQSQEPTPRESRKRPYGET